MSGQRVVLFYRGDPVKRLRLDDQRGRDCVTAACDNCVLIHNVIGIIMSMRILTMLLLLLLLLLCVVLIRVIDVFAVVVCSG